VDDMSTGTHHLEPLQQAQALAGLGQGILNGILDAGRGGAYQFHQLVGVVIGHAVALLAWADTALRSWTADRWVSCPARARNSIGKCSGYASPLLRPARRAATAPDARRGCPAGGAAPTGPGAQRFPRSPRVPAGGRQPSRRPPAGGVRWPHPGRPAPLPTGSRG